MQTKMSSVIRAAVTASVVLGLAACTGEIVEPVTTDYGIAVATTERADTGDVESWLTSRDGHTLLGEMHATDKADQAWATVADTPVEIAGILHIDDASFAQANELLHALWENEVTGEAAGAVCVGNELAICCRDTMWHCSAH